MIEKIKSINRALLELCLGILFLGLLSQVIIFFAFLDIARSSIALWFGVCMAIVTAIHMYRTLDEALDYGADAPAKVNRAGLLRYGAFIILFGIIMVTKVWNPLITFWGLMTLKVAAYLQPFTHRLCNLLFHETDPIPQPMDGEE